MLKRIAVSSSLSSQFQNLDNPDVCFVSWQNEIVFNDEHNVPAALILDIDRPESLDIVSAVREVFDSEMLPVYGLISKKSLRLRNLFLACGGTDLLSSAGELPEPDSRKEPGKLDFPIRISLSQGDSVRRLLDNLEKQTIKKDLTAISGKTEVLSKTIELLLETLHRLVKVHISVMLINNNQNVESYVMPSRGIFREDYNDFINFCLNDFFSHFRGINIENPAEIIFVDKPEEFDKIKIGTRKLSSYFYLPLRNSRGEVIGTIHLGHLSNNYFQGVNSELIEELVKRMEPPLYLSLKTSQNIIRQNKIFDIFSKFVPPEIIPDLIAQEADRRRSQVQKKNITVLFSDIRSFTTITEENNAQQVVDFLNRHFDMMVGIIKKYGGTIDKFIGDAIVAVFGLKENSEQMNIDAVRAAVGMINSLGDVDCSDLSLPGAGYNIGIGIHQSEAIVGNIGSPDKSSFTAIGDVVGIAEELEGTTKQYRKQILVSKKVYDDVRSGIMMEAVVKAGDSDEWPEGLYTPGSRAYEEMKNG